MPDTFALVQPSTKPRKRKAVTLREVDWAPHKECIMGLLDEGFTLNQVKRMMESGLEFIAEYDARVVTYFIY